MRLQAGVVKESETADVSLQRSDSITITKKLRRAGRGVGFTIPAELVALMDLDESTVVEITLRKVTSTKVKLPEGF